MSSGVEVMAIGLITCERCEGVQCVLSCCDEKKRTRRGVVAQERVMQGQVSRARQALTGGAVAPRTLETLEEFRRKRSQKSSSADPSRRHGVHSRDTCRIERKSVCHVTSECAQRIRCRPWRVYVRNASGVELLRMLMSAAEDFARAAVPRVVFKAFQQADMTGDGGVTSFRRLVARGLARQFSKEVERACASFQFALSKRAGTDCVGHLRRALTDASPHCDRVARGWH